MTDTSPIDAAAGSAPTAQSVTTAEPKVAIVTAVYNGADHILETLESVREQTLTNFEMVVVDDGSDDATPEIVRSFPDVRIRMIESGGRKGVSAARNLGLETCSAPLVVFLDADDLLLPEALERMVASLDAHPGAVACFGHHIKISITGDPIGGTEPSALKKLPAEDTLRHLVARNFICNGGALCMRTAAAREVGGFDPELRFGEDREFWCRVAVLSDFVFVPETFLKYRVRPSGANNSLAGTATRINTDAIDRIFGSPEIRAQFTERDLRALEHKAYANDHWSAARNQLFSGRFFSFLQFLVVGLARYPDSLLNWRLIYLFFHSLKPTRNHSA